MLVVCACFLCSSFVGSMPLILCVRVSACVCVGVVSLCMYMLLCFICFCLDHVYVLAFRVFVVCWFRAYVLDSLFLLV